MEGAVYDTSHQVPKVKRIDVFSTVHIGQYSGKKHDTPNNPEGRELLGEENEVEFPHWTETEIPLVDKHFNLLLQDDDPELLPSLVSM